MLFDIYSLEIANIPTTTPMKIETITGENTAHHDHWIKPNNFNMTNISVSTSRNPILYSLTSLVTMSKGTRFIVVMFFNNSLFKINL